MQTPSSLDTRSTASIDTPAFEALVHCVNRGDAKLCDLVAFIHAHQARVVADAVAPLAKALEMESAALADAVRHVGLLKDRQALPQATAIMDARPIGYAPEYLPQRLAAGDPAVMLTITRNPLPGVGASVPLFTALALASMSLKTYQQGFDAGKACSTESAPGTELSQSKAAINTPSISTATLRKAFEAEYLGRFDLRHDFDDPERYYSFVTDPAWRAWKTAAVRYAKAGEDQTLRETLNLALEASTTGHGSYGPNYDGNKLAVAVKAALADPR